MIMCGNVVFFQFTGSISVKLHGMTYVLLVCVCVCVKGIT